MNSDTTILMYPIDRRNIAIHIYGIVKSLRKTALLLLIAHQNNRPLYTRKLCFRQQHLNSSCIRIHLFEYNSSTTISNFMLTLFCNDTLSSFPLGDGELELYRLRVDKKA